MKKIFFILVLTMCVVTGFAVLPPFYHSSNEIRRILEDPKTHEKLGSGQLIVEIRKVDSGWIIKTPKYEMLVDVIYLPSERIGASNFELEFHDPIELNYTDRN
jgi:hypothetical protein